MKTVRWGILSTARIGEVMLEAARRSSRARVVAIASRDPGQAAAMAESHGVELSFGSYEELLESDRVDAVYIPLPNGLHTEWATNALRAGKHVLCEKPLGRRPDEVAAAFNVAEQARKVLAEAFMYRYHPQTTLARRLVDDGAIGRLGYIKATLSFTMPHGDVRASKALDGGSLMDLGCYCLNASRLFAGEPERVYAEQLTAGEEVDMQLAATMRMPNDVLAQFDCGFALPRRDRLELVGSEGEIVLRDPWLCRERAIELHCDGRVESVPVDPGNQLGLEHDDFDVYKRELDTVTGAIATDTPLQYGRDDAVAQSRALDALLRSAELHTPIETGDADVRFTR
jgi:xylose dehydrogenase (NAD/NADP)